MAELGEYQIVRLVGEGGMGKVYEATERLSGRRVALKLLRPELARSAEARGMFRGEMTILAQLDHPNVVRSLSCSEVDGELVMALEFLEGRTLRSVLLDEGRLAWPEALAIALQIARALAAAHRLESPVVHRDLKPENVMVLPDGSIKVMDFGIAKVLEALAGTTTHSAGTLQYMSPEQIDAARIDGRSDLYCLGLVLYELLSGRAPFESASARELLNRQCTERPPALPEAVRRTLPGGVERLLYELLEKSPDARPSSADDVVHELEPFAPAAASSARSVVSEKGVGPRQETLGGEASASDTLLSVPSEPARSEGIPSSKRGAPSRRARPRVADTLAMIESALSDRELPTRRAWAYIAGAALAAALVTYGARLTFSPGQDVSVAEVGER